MNGIIAADTLEVVLGVGQATGRLIDDTAGLIALDLKLVHTRLGGPNCRSGVLTAPSQIGALRELRGEGVLHTADFGKQGRALALKTRDLPRNLTITASCILDGVVCLGHTALGGVEHGAQVRLEAFEFANAALTLESAGSRAGRTTNAHNATIADASTVGRDIQHTRANWRLESFFEGIH